MKFKPQVFNIPIDISSEKYAQCIAFIDEHKNKIALLRRASPEKLYIDECFMEISDIIFNEMKYFRNCKKFKIGDIYDERAEHIYSLGNDNHSVYILKNTKKDTNIITGKPELFITYIPRSISRWLFKPDYFKKILTDYHAETADKCDRDIIRDSLTLDKMLARATSYH